ncbi:MAG: GAF domain-containing protein [Verrucomicrobia bacterium]|nr:GAF domain-containing protein [Cytophagales bacterium]
MKNIYRSISFITTPLYMVVCAIVFFILWQFPEKAAKILNIIDRQEVDEVKRLMLLQIYLPVGIMFLLSAIALVMHILAYQKQVNSYQLASPSDIASTRTQENIKENLAVGDDAEYNLLAVKNVWEQENFADETNRWEKLLTVICNQMEASQAAYYKFQKEEGKVFLEFKAGYAYYLPESKPIRFELGEGLVGQAAKDGKLVNISEIPEGYVTILSGLGKSTPAHLGIIPIRTEGNLSGMIEMASFKKITKADENFLNSVATIVGR